MIAIGRPGFKNSTTQSPDRVIRLPAVGPGLHLVFVFSEGARRMQHLHPHRSPGTVSRRTPNCSTGPKVGELTVSFLESVRAQEQVLASVLAELS